MAQTIMDLFKDQKKDLYGLSATVYIETRGLVHPPRAAALLLSSPNSVADLIGSAASGLLKGNANRPTDTIFKNNKPFTKPVSIISTQSGVKYAADGLESAYVKTSPSPGAGIANFIKGAVSSPAGAQSAAIAALNKFGNKNANNQLNTFINGLKKPNDAIAYGTQYMITDPAKADKPSGMITEEDGIKYSKYYTKYVPNINKITGTPEVQKLSVKQRTNTEVLAGKSPFDVINYDILSNLKTNYDLSDDDLKKITDKNSKIHTPYVLFKLYGKANSNILLPGTISGLSEDYAPEVSAFKYVGSPFNVYKYGGVERSLKFDIRLYFVDQETKASMNRNLDKLRKLVFPDEDISVIKYEGNGGYSPLVFNPNLVYLTINGVYDNVLGILDSLSISIEDETPWVTSNFSLDGGDEKPSPAVYNVSIGMKIIERPAIQDNKYQYGQFQDENNKENKYVNYFTGLNALGYATSEEVKYKQIQQAANANAAVNLPRNYE